MPNASHLLVIGVDMSFPVRWRQARAGLLASLMALTLSGCSSMADLSNWFGRLGRSSPAVVPPDTGVPWGTPVGGIPVGGTAAAKARVEDPAYLIGPEDALEISVWKEEQLKSTTLVRPDGGISFPLAGDLLVAGRTAEQVRQEIVKRLTRFVPDAEVTVSVVRVASYRVYVIGRVNKPGDIAVGRNIDVLQALSLAGGMTPFASEDGIQIIRRVDGKPVSIPFDYSRIRKGGDLSQNITLRSGDVLLVP
jgi:polysaccharide export outer membrane protein